MINTEQPGTAQDWAVKKIRLPGHEEYSITSHGEGASVESLREISAELDAQLLSQFTFIDGAPFSKSEDAVASSLSTCLYGRATDAPPVRSMQGVAIAGLALRPVYWNNRQIGTVYEDADARYCRLSAVVPDDTEADRSGQTRAAFEITAAVLAKEGFQFTDVVRTWIYLDRLLDWYDDFNAVRTRFFEEHGVFDHRVPASTGIGAANAFGAAITMDVLAVQPKSGALSIEVVSSPLQNSALDYKSSFSRAIELAGSTHRNLMISGTASIDPEGRTVHLDDPEKQIRLTLEVVQAILESRGMDWSHLHRGIAYFKDPAYLPVYQRIATEMNIPDEPVALSYADVCRDDLLFEIEVDAVTERAGG